MRIMVLSHQPQNPADRTNHQRNEGLLRSYASPGTQVDLCYVDDFPGARVFAEMGAQSMLTGLHHAMAIPAIIRKTVWAERNGYDAVVQSNTFDPGVEAGRLAVRIPVIGVFRTSLHVAATLADRIGVTVPLESHVPYTWRILKGYGMEPFVTDIRALGVYGANLRSRQSEIFGKAVELLRSMVADTGAEVLLPLGGALIPYVVSPADLEREVGLTVLDTKAIGIRFAEMCVQLRMAHSARTYPAVKLRYEDFAAPAYEGVGA